MSLLLLIIVINLSNKINRNSVNFRRTGSRKKPKISWNPQKYILRAFFALFCTKTDVLWWTGVLGWTKNTNWRHLVSFISNQFDYEKYIGDIGFKKDSDATQIFTVSSLENQDYQGVPGYHGRHYVQSPTR